MEFTAQRKRVDRLVEMLRSHLATAWPSPVFVRLSDFARKRGELSDYLITPDCGVPLDKQTLERLLVKGRFWVLCDGLDETGPKRDYLVTQQRITNFAKEYPLVPVVVTCRTSAFYPHSLDGFARYAIDRLDDEQIRTLVEKWFCRCAWAGSQPSTTFLCFAAHSSIGLQPLSLINNCRYFRTAGPTATASK